MHLLLLYSYVCSLPRVFQCKPIKASLVSFRMRFGTNTLTQAERWDQLFRLIRPISKSPFFSKAYYDSYSNVEQGEAQCFWGYKDEKNFLFYPYLRKSINSLAYDLPTDYHDISGAYGYNVCFYSESLEMRSMEDKLIV